MLILHNNVAASHHKVLVSQDKAIELQNKRLKTAHIVKTAAMQRLLLHESYAGPSSASGQRAQATKAFECANQAYDKAVAGSLASVGSGSGKVGILLPNEAIHQVSPRKFQSHGRGSM